MINGHDIQRATWKINIKPPLSKPTKNKLPPKPFSYFVSGGGGGGIWEEPRGGRILWLRAQKLLY